MATIRPVDLRGRSSKDPRGQEGRGDVLGTHIYQLLCAISRKTKYYPSIQENQINIFVKEPSYLKFQRSLLTVQRRELPPSQNVGISPSESTQGKVTVPGTRNLLPGHCGHHRHPDVTLAKAERGAPGTGQGSRLGWLAAPRGPPRAVPTEKPALSSSSGWPGGGATGSRAPGPSARGGTSSGLPACGLSALGARGQQRPTGFLRAKLRSTFQPGSQTPAGMSSSRPSGQVVWGRPCWPRNPRTFGDLLQRKDSHLARCQQVPLAVCTAGSAA